MSIFEVVVSGNDATSCLAGGQFDVVVGSLALHTLVGHSTVLEADIRERYRSGFTDN